MHGAKTWVEIHEQALRLNVAALRSLMDERIVFSSVVKANAYGHGLKEVVQILYQDGVRFFCVDNIDEAQEVNAIAPEATVLILGYTPMVRLPEVVKAGFHQVVYDPDILTALQKIGLGLQKKALVHLKIETGTLRQGVLPEMLPEFLLQAKQSGAVDVVGVSTHFANAEEADDPTFVEYQTGRFWQACTVVEQIGFSPRYIHSACSAAFILYPETQGTMVRAGIAQYGFWPSRETRHAARFLNRRIELEPVLSWKTSVAQVKEVPMGAPVGYNGTEILRRHSKIAILPVGYSDGFDRRLSSVGEVLIRGQLCRVIGRVCMNMFMVDVTDVSKAKVEDEVVLLGKQGSEEITAEEMAEKIGTINYEIVTRINPLIKRVIRGKN